MSDGGPRLDSLFRLEADLCAEMLKIARTALDRDPAARVFEQLTVGPVIPDVVMVHMSRAETTSRPARPLAGFESFVLAETLRRSPIRSSTISERLFAQAGRVREALTSLQRAGFVVRNETGSYSAETEWWRSATVVAVEAKLLKWREAVEQAESYRTFANASYVALPIDLIETRRDVLRRTCREKGLGLVGVGAGKLWIELPAPFSDIRSADWIRVVSRALDFSDSPRSAEMRRAKRADAADLCAD